MGRDKFAAPSIFDNMKLAFFFFPVSINFTSPDFINYATKTTLCVKPHILVNYFGLSPELF